MSVMTVNFGHKKYGFQSVRYENGIDVSPYNVMSNQHIELTKMQKVERTLNKMYSFILPSAFFAGVLNMSSPAFAASTSGLAERMMPLIHMVQDLAMPVGIVVASWGLIEIIMGNFESGKHKLKYAVIGFIGMFLIPEVFYAIRDAFGASSVGVPTPSMQEIEEARRILESVKEVSN